MKINPIDLAQSTRPATAAEKNRPDQGAFQRILEQTVAKPTVDRQPGIQNAHSLLSSRIVPVATFNAPLYQGAERMLDALERYQALLADPRISLPAIEPAIRQVQKESEALQPLLAALPDGDPLKATLTSAMTLAAKEIARYERGEYLAT